MHSASPGGGTLRLGDRCQVMGILNVTRTPSQFRRYAAADHRRRRSGWRPTAPITIDVGGNPRGLAPTDLGDGLSRVAGAHAPSRLGVRSPSTPTKRSARAAVAAGGLINDAAACGTMR